MAENGSSTAQNWHKERFKPKGQYKTITKERKNMKKATFSEYQEAKAEVMKDGECREYVDTDEYGRLHKTICCEDGNNFYEVTENGITEFWSTKHSASRKYEEPQEAAQDAAENKEDDYRERRKKVIKRLYALIYWFADEMLSEEEAEAREAAEFEREKAEKPGELLMRVSAHDHNASVMKDCMKAARDAANYLRDKENDVEDWQIAGINAMFDQCNKESIVPYDLPYAINGLLLQWDRATVGAGAMLEAVKE